MLVAMHISGNLVLALRVGYDLLVFQQQLVRLVTLRRDQFIMCCRAPKPALFCSIGAIRILSVLEVESYFIEPFFRHIVFSLRT
jgi:hypothetical protein